MRVGPQWREHRPFWGARLPIFPSGLGLPLWERHVVAHPGIRARSIHRMSNNLDTSNESKRQRSLWLSRHGGWVLLAGSVVLIALAALFSRRAAVAPIFALGGIALVILGVLLPRIEGVFEFNTTGFKFFLAEIGRESRELPPAVKAQVLDTLLESASKRGLPPEADPGREARRLVEAALGHSELEAAAARWLEEQGWSIKQAAPTPSGRRADIIAERDGELLVIEVKDDRGTRNWSDVRYQLNRIREGLQRDRSPRIALFLGQPPPPQILSRIVGDGFEVWIRNDDGFERIR
jgi:hypothetical protein